MWPLALRLKRCSQWPGRSVSSLHLGGTRGYRGFDVEVIQAIAKLQGFQGEFRDLPWTTIITAWAQGKSDIIASGLSVTCERAKVADFSLP